MKNKFCLSLFALLPVSFAWAMMPIDTTEMFTVAPGCEYMAIRWLRQNNDSTSGINSFILRVDAKNPNVSFQQRLGKGTLMGREKLSKMARHLNEPLGTNPVCIAAVNGDFFWMENEARENGLPRGFTVQDNEFVVTTDEDRRLGGITEDKLGLVGSHGIWTGAVSFNNAIIPLARINYCRKDNELVLFNQYNDRSTNTDANGTEVLLELLPGQKWHCNCTVTARVVKVEKNIGSMLIPDGMVVLSGSGEKAEALNRLQEEDVVTITSAFSVDGVATNYNQCIGSDQYAMILKDGVVETQNFWPGDHPRNSFGYTQSRDTFFFVLVDGRIPESPGCTTSELGEMMRQIGCYNATNWDGGRSAHLWLRGRGFMNKGCDKRGERAISNGMFIFYRSEHQYNKDLDSLLQADVTRAGGNYTGYDFSERTFTPAPKGYEAFYLSHYGRHGSRSRHNSQPYELLLQVLDSAKAANNLTEKGAELYTFTQDLITLYNNMPSRLTDKGEREHTQLAERMYQRLPEIFAQKTGQIRAISSMKPRCLMSMAACTNQLARMNTNLTFDMDCGQEIQKIISPASDDEIKPCSRTRDSLVALLDIDTTIVCQRLFLRPNEMPKICSAKALQEAVYETVVTAQCFDRYANIYDFLPANSIYRLEMDMAWRLWLPFGHNDLQTAMRREGVQLALNDIIAKADAAICNLQPATCNQPSVIADLRFGHDTQMLSVLAAMQVSGIGEKMTPEELEYKWYTFRDLPMASNTQLIFYHPKKKANTAYSDDEILVKVLYNETERQLIGLEPVDGVYYRWSDIKNEWTKQTEK